MQAGAAWQVSGLQQRGLAADSGSESHDDFKPKRKAPPADLDGAVGMVDEQVGEE